jgi:hypothetical protein
MPPTEPLLPAVATARPFADASVEAQYRLERLPADRRLAATLIGIGAALTAPLVVVDLAAVASNPAFTWLLPARAGVVLIGLVAAVASARVRRPATLDALTFAWAVTLAALALGVGPTRPRSYTVNFAFEAIIITGNWALLPSTLRRQALAGLIHTACSMVVAARWRDLGGPVAPAIGLALLSANVIGWFASTRLHLARRAEFLERRRLAAALAEVRTLRGLIPICASCKSIRTEDGDWHRLEQYLTEHTDALLTHGLCEACCRRLYPEAPTGAAGG